MTAHELAYELLKQEDIVVVTYSTINGDWDEDVFISTDLIKLGGRLQKVVVIR